MLLGFTVSLSAPLTAGSPGTEAAHPEPSSLRLEVGEIRSLPAQQVQRVAIGNPDVADVTVLSSKEILLQAKAAGATQLIVWDAQGQQIVDVEIVDRAQEGLEGEVRQLVSDLKLTGVRVKREGKKLVLVGEVARQEELDRLDQVLGRSYATGVTNLVTVAPSAAAIPSGGPLVKLSVQVLDVSRSDLERIGVKWSESIALADDAVTDRTLSNALFRWGTSLSRSSVQATLSALVEQKRARILSEPKLVTASGKEASSFVGLEIPIVSATSFGTTTQVVSTSIEFRKTGVRLRMTPHVLPDAPESDGPAPSTASRITTVIEAEVSSLDSSVALIVPVGSQTVSVPGFRVRKANTEVMTHSGETVIIAGLVEAEDKRTVSQVPALGSVPFFGRLFRSPDTSSSQREIIIAVTPEVLHERDEGRQAVAAERLTAVEAALTTAHAAITATPHTPQTPRIPDPSEAMRHYTLQVHERLAKAMRYPIEQWLQSHGTQVTLRLHLARDGTLKEALIVSPSGIEAFDQTALQTAQRQSPYPPFPSEVPQQDLWLELPVRFQP